MNKNELTIKVKEGLAIADLSYTVLQEDETDTLISLGVSLHGLLQSCKSLILVDEDGIVVRTSCPINAQKEHFDSTMAYLIHTQRGMKRGHFEIDPMDGEVLFSNFIEMDVAEFYPTEKLLMNMLTGVMMFKRYGNGLVKNMLGFGDPLTDAIEADAALDDDDSF